MSKLEIIKTNKGYMYQIYAGCFKVVSSGDFREAEIHGNLTEDQKGRIVAGLQKQGYSDIEFIEVEVTMKG